MKALIEYWPLIFMLFITIFLGGYALYVFIKRPTSDQLKKVKEWLLYATSRAEKELGGGTGQIKLRYVYDMFLAKFPYLAQVIPFEQFSDLVDEALEKFRKMLEDNTAVKEYVSSPTKVVIENAPAKETNV